MELRQLQTFTQIAQMQSFSRTAEMLGYSQSAVTVQIRQLENELGKRLFDRTGKKVVLSVVREWERGGIGIRSGLKIRRLRACGFESHRSYQSKNAQPTFVGTCFWGGARGWRLNVASFVKHYREAGDKEIHA